VLLFLQRSDHFSGLIRRGLPKGLPRLSKA